MGKMIKNNLAKVIFKALGRGMKGVYKLDADMRAFALELPSGYTARIKVLGSGVNLVFATTDRGIKVFNAKNSPICVDLDIVFKSIELLFPILIGAKGIRQSFAEHDFTMQGDVPKAMNVVNMINLTESYLFPNCMVRKIVSPIPRRENSKGRLYAYFIFGV